MKEETFENWWKDWLQRQFGCKLFNDDGSPAATYSVPKEFLLRKRDFLVMWNHQQEKIDKLKKEIYERN